MGDGTRRTCGLLLTATAFPAVVVGFSRVLLTGTCESNPPPGVKECPASDVPFVVAFVLGVASMLVAIFALSTWESFAAAFAALGVAAVWAGLQPRDEGGQGWFLPFGAMFLLGALPALVRLSHREDA